MNMNKLQKIRTKHKLSCGDMSAILNISRTYYWQLENGLRTLSYKQAIRIANIFKLKPDDIFYEDLKD